MVEQHAPPHVANETIAQPSRRRFLNRLWAILGLAAVAEFCWLAVSFLDFRKERNQHDKTQRIITVGAVDHYKPATVTAIPQGAFYLSCLSDGSFMALSQTCTHLGCSIHWDEEKQQFACPCHGSTFNPAGELITSPAPRPLDYYPVRIEDGIIKVDISTALRRERFESEQAARLDHPMDGKRS